MKLHLVLKKKRNKEKFIIFISDTHGLHHHLTLKGGDVLIHAGDITEYGTDDEVFDFVNWLGKQNFKHKIFIAGNHDLYLENTDIKQFRKKLPANVHYLQNSFVMVDGIKIYGSPVSPYFLGMAFNKKRGDEIKKVWNKIPLDTKILITHTPPLGIMDNNMGCEDLLKRIKIVQPQIHVFGHIHEQMGLIEKNSATFINQHWLITLIF